MAQVTVFQVGELNVEQTQEQIVKLIEESDYFIPLTKVIFNTSTIYSGGSKSITTKDDGRRENILVDKKHIILITNN